MKILLVEDNPGDARLLREYLRDTSLGEYDVLHAETLAEAHEILGREPIDVVLLDLSLPDSHGLETVRRTLPHTPEVPIVVLSGLDDETIAVHAVQAGAQDYLVKGRIDSQLLMRAIRYALERKRLDTDRVRALEREQEARAAAEAAVRARDEVMGIVSHDLGNSLSAIRLHSHLLERSQITDPAEVAKRTRTIRQLVEQMHHLRQDLLDVVSLEAGRLAIEPDVEVVESVIAEAVEALDTLAQEKRIDLRARVQDDLPPVLADRSRLLQVLSNLLGNALKFTPPGGRVTVSAERLGEGVQISVEDTGPGLDPGDAARVFDSFWRKERGERGGAGLGLAIARGIVAGHGGRIWVESERGEGSAFRFTLQAAPG